jgi:aspartate racemase
MKTVGVLGGIGPQATMDFEARFHRAAQALIPQRGNSGYPPLIVVYLRHAPVMLHDDGSPLLPVQPDPRLFEAAATLGQLADFLVITANAPQVFAEQIAQAAGRPVLNMIDLALAEAQRRGLARIGVLGLGEPTVYTTRLDALGIPYETDDGPHPSRLDGAIMATMEGQSGPELTQAAVQAVDWLRARGVDGVILGCTELPLLLGEAAAAPDLIDPAQLLAEAAVREAVG